MHAELRVSQRRALRDRDVRGFPLPLQAALLRHVLRELVPQALLQRRPLPEAAAGGAQRVAKLRRPLCVGLQLRVSLHLPHRLFRAAVREKGGQMKAVIVSLRRSALCGGFSQQYQVKLAT